MDTTGLRQRRPISHSHSTGNNDQPDQDSHDKEFKHDFQKRSDDDFETIVRSEIIAAIDDSLTKNHATNPNGFDSFHILEQEARKMLASVEASTVRDRLAHKHNVYMTTRRRFFYLVGFLCLVCPVLVIFDSLISFFPPNHIEVLHYASGEDTSYGIASRICLNVILTARSLSEANTRKNSAYMSGCFGILAMLLLLVRYKTSKRPVLTQKQRKEMVIIKQMIEEELRKKKNLLAISRTPSCSSMQ